MGDVPFGIGHGLPCLHAYPRSKVRGILVGVVALPAVRRVAPFEVENVPIDARVKSPRLDTTVVVGLGRGVGSGEPGGVEWRVAHVLTMGSV